MSLHDDAQKAIGGMQAAIDALQAALDADDADKADLTAQLAAAHAQIDALAAVVAADEATIAELRAKVAALSPPLFANPLTDLSAFTVYNAAGSYSQQGARLAGNSVVSGGVLSVHARPVTSPTPVGGKTLNPGDYAAGAVVWRQPLTPGCRIACDLLMPASVGTRAVALLWPYQGDWPQDGELDFIENGADIPDRQSTAITNHWFDATKVSPSNPQGNAQRVVKFGPHDFTKWSHVEVLWQVGLFVVTVDGVEAARYTDHVPTGPMQVVFQTAVAGGGQSPTWNGQPRSPGRLDVKNLNVYPA